MGAQMVATAFKARKAAYDRVQQLVTGNLPVIFLVSPHVLAAGDRNLGNFEPAATDPVLLWNAERLFWRKPTS
jgi:ABC-type transport system substrate-binding protein